MLANRDLIDINKLFLSCSLRDDTGVDFPFFLNSQVIPSILLVSFGYFVISKLASIVLMRCFNCEKNIHLAQDTKYTNPVQKLLGGPVIKFTQGL